MLWLTLVSWAALRGYHLPFFSFSHRSSSQLGWQKGMCAARPPGAGLCDTAGPKNEMVRQRLVLFSTYSRASCEPCIPTSMSILHLVQESKFKLSILWVLGWDCICWAYARERVTAYRKEQSLTVYLQLGWEVCRSVEVVADSHYLHNFTLST